MDEATAKKFVLSLADANTHALGFLPAATLAAYVEAERVRYAFENGEPCGYIIAGPPKPKQIIYQTCISYDARRRENGLSLVQEIIAAANAAKVERLSLHCAADLEANEFWKAAGFELVGERRKKRKHERPQNRFELELYAGRARRELEARAIHDRSLQNLNALLGAWDSKHTQAKTVIGYHDARGTDARR